MAKMSTIYGAEEFDANVSLGHNDVDEGLGGLHLERIRLAGGPYAGHLAVRAAMPRMLPPVEFRPH